MNFIYFLINFLKSKFLLFIMAIDTNLIKMHADIERYHNGAVGNEDYQDNLILSRINQNAKKWREEKLAEMKKEGKDISKYVDNNNYL